PMLTQMCGSVPTVRQYWMNSSVPKRFDSSAYQASSLRRGRSASGPPPPNPGDPRPGRRIRGRPPPVEPVIAADEVAAGPAQDGDAQRPHRIQHVAPEPSLVAERRALLEDAAVDAAADMVEEVSKDSPVHRADLPIQVDSNRGHASAL